MQSQLFEIMRFNILLAALNPVTASKVNDAYVFAWYHRVYPFAFGEDLQHETFSSAFRVDKTMIEELGKFLDQMWLAKTVPTFYDLETKYRGRGGWDRMELVYAIHYMKLANLFDDSFRTELMKNHPSEASSISRKYDRENDVYLN